LTASISLVCGLAIFFAIFLRLPPNKFLRIPPDLSPVSIRLALLFLLLRAPSWPVLARRLSVVTDTVEERAPRLPEAEFTRELAMKKVMDAPLAEVRAEINKHFEALDREHWDHTERRALMTRWAEARAALRADPDAELPK
jgi:hypothetical protein